VTPVTVVYANRRAYDKGRPYAWVVLVNGIVAGRPKECLVDTGADYLQLPEIAAREVGLPVTGTLRTVATASGVVTLNVLSGVVAEIEGHRVTVDLVLTPGDDGPAILGRQALLSALEVGFNRREWLWT